MESSLIPSSRISFQVLSVATAILREAYSPRTVQSLVVYRGKLSLGAMVCRHGSFVPLLATSEMASEQLALKIMAADLK